MKKAIENLNKHGIEALVVIGGDGSYMGAKKLTEMGYPCIGLRAQLITISQVLITHHRLPNCTEHSYRIHWPSTWHIFISPTYFYRRNHGSSLWWFNSNIGNPGGCEYIITPETGLDMDSLISNIQDGIKKVRSTQSSLLLSWWWMQNVLAKEIEKATKRETRATILGHIQRGGKPTAFDRVLASRMVTTQFTH